jgi:hypothetical protein
LAGAIFAFCLYNGSWVVSIKQNVNSKFKPPAMYVFVVSRKSCLPRSCSCSKGLSAYKTSWFHVDWWKFCIRLRSLNFRYFWMVEATGLKIMESRSPSMAWTPYWIY